jgi:hypothetical protein
MEVYKGYTIVPLRRLGLYIPWIQAEGKEEAIEVPDAPFRTKMEAITFGKTMVDHMEDLLAKRVLLKVSVDDVQDWRVDDIKASAVVEEKTQNTKYCNGCGNCPKLDGKDECAYRVEDDGHYY